VTDDEKLAATFDILVDRLGLGYDSQFTAPVPQWFFDELVAAWIRHEGDSEEEIEEALVMEGWQVE